MAQDLNTPAGAPPKLIDIESVHAKELLGMEETGPQISNDQPLRKWLYDWTLNPNIIGNFQKSLDSWIGLLIVAMAMLGKAGVVGWLQHRLSSTRKISSATGGAA